MKKSQQPTLAQAGFIRETAIELGVDREMFQSLRDDGTWTHILKERRDQILSERENILTFELTATVQQNRGYCDALEAAGPDTSSSNNARKVADLYPPVSETVEEVSFVLRNFPKDGGSWDKALAWAKANGYKLTNPREVFAVVEQHDLRKLLDCNWLYLVATTECNFGGCRLAVCVGVYESSRSADLDGLEYFSEVSGWFLFRK